MLIVIFSFLTFFIAYFFGSSLPIDPLPHCPNDLGQRLPHRRLPPPEELGRRPGASSRGAEEERRIIPKTMLALLPGHRIHDLHDAAGEAELRRSPSPDSVYNNAWEAKKRGELVGWSSSKFQIGRGHV